MVGWNCNQNNGGETMVCLDGSLKLWQQQEQGKMVGRIFFKHSLWIALFQGCSVLGQVFFFSQDANHPEQPLRVLKVYEHLEKQGHLVSSIKRYSEA